MEGRKEMSVDWKAFGGLGGLGWVGRVQLLVQEIKFDPRGPGSSDVKEGGQN